MATELYLGTPGAGKTISIVDRIMVPQCRNLDSRKVAPENRRRMLTNIDGIEEYRTQWKFMTDVGLSDLENGLIQFPINFDIWEYEVTHDLKGTEIFKFKYLKEGDIVIYDEAQIPFPKSFSKGEKYERFVALMTQHRKYHLDFYFLTQDPKNLTECIFGLVDCTYLLRKRRFFGSTKTYTEHMYNGGSTLAKSKLGHKTRKYNVDCFKLYKSHKVVGTEHVKTFNVFFTPKMIALYTAIILCFSVPGYIISQRGLFPKPKSLSTTQKQDAPSGGEPSQLASTQNISVIIQGYTINENLCQAFSSEGVVLLPASVCGHLPYQYNGKTYIQGQIKDPESGNLF